MPDETPLIKDAGELKEAHAARLATMALPVFDIDTYVEEFARSIVPAYRRGLADAEWPADVGIARSIIPPGTSATRDFSRLAPRIPEFLLDKCVGCMACVSACPTRRSSASSCRSRNWSRGSRHSLRFSLIQ
jgi:ferredoxin